MSVKNLFWTKFCAWTGPEFRWAGVDISTLDDIVMHVRDWFDDGTSATPEVELSITNGRIEITQSTLPLGVLSLSDDGSIVFDGVLADVKAEDTVVIAGATNTENNVTANILRVDGLIAYTDVSFTEEGSGATSVVNLLGRFVPLLSAAEMSAITGERKKFDIVPVIGGEWQKPLSHGDIDVRVPQTRPPVGDDLIDTPDNTPSNAMLDLDGQPLLWLDGTPVLEL